MAKRYGILIGIGLLGLNLALMIAGIFLLPPQVGMQIGTSGSLQNFVPKWVAVTLPAAIGGLCSLFFCFKKSTTAAIVAAVMVVVQVLALAFN